MCAVCFVVSCDTDLSGSWSPGALLWVMLSGPALSWPNPLQAASAWLGNLVYTRWKFSWSLGIKPGNLSFRVRIYLNKNCPFSLWEDRTKQTWCLSCSSSRECCSLTPLRWAGQVNICSQVFSSYFGKAKRQILLSCICTAPNTAEFWCLTGVARDFYSTNNKYIMHLLQSSQTFHVIYALIWTVWARFWSWLFWSKWDTGLASHP